MVLRQAGLPMGLLNQEKILVTTEELFSLYRGIAQVSRDPAIGLKLGTEDQIERYDPIAIAALLHAFVSRCVTAHGPLQAAYLSGKD
jgi:hypothetical protein